MGYVSSLESSLITCVDFSAMFCLSKKAVDCRHPICRALPDGAFDLHLNSLILVVFSTRGMSRVFNPVRGTVEICKYLLGMTCKMQSMSLKRAVSINHSSGIAQRVRAAQFELSASFSFKWKRPLAKIMSIPAVSSCYESFRLVHCILSTY